MRRVFKFISIIVIVLFLFKTFYSVMFIFSGTEKSLERMLITLSNEEKTEFINNFELISDVLDEDKMIGLNVNQIKKLANTVRSNIAKKNVNFLTSYIEYLKQSNKNSSYLNISNTGQISAPKVGYNYKKEYSISDMEYMLKANGDYSSYKYIMEYKQGFLENCQQEICECVFEKFISKYSVKEIQSFEKVSDEIIKILNEFVNECK